jgi:Tol biopolymer transport system component
MDGQGSMLLLDTESGKLYSPSDRNGQDGPSISMTWSPDGSLLVQMYPRRSDERATDTLFIGPPLGPMTPVSATETYVSSRGVAASYEPGAMPAVVIREIATRHEIARLNLKPGQYAGPWSPDGRFLPLRFGGDFERKVNPSVTLWDLDTRQVVLEIPAYDISWANQHNRFLYEIVDAKRGDDSFVESRVHDMDSGTDYVINTRSGIVLWSPDDRYIVANAPHNERTYAFSVFDALNGRVLTTARGSWPVAWIDQETIGFMANVCTNSMSLYYVNGGGSNLRRILDMAGYGVAHPSPHGGRVAYTVYGQVLPQKNIVRIVDVASGQNKEFDVGTTYLLPYPWANQRVWSPDGHYLLLMSPVGKGGPCMGSEPEPFQIIRHP